MGLDKDQEAKGITNPPPVEPALNMDGLDSDSDENGVDVGQVEVEAVKVHEEPHLVLMRQVENITKTQSAATKDMITLKKLISLGSPAERCTLYTGWFFAGITGAVLPSFFFLIGDVFDSFGPENDDDEKLDSVVFLVIVMGCLGCIVLISGSCMHSQLTKGSMLITRRTKTAYMNAIIAQESAWYDMSNYTELSSRITAECGTIEKGIGQKYGQILQSFCMCISALALAFIKGWSLALPMLLLGPIIVIGFSILIKVMTERYVHSAAAYAQCASFCD